MSASSPLGQEGLYRALVEGAPDAILTIDVRSIVLSANPAAARLFGYAATDMVGRGIATLEEYFGLEAAPGYL